MTLLMTSDDLDDFIRGLGHTVEISTDANGLNYTVVRNLELKKGSLAGKICDVAIARVTLVPYVLPSAIHTRPPLLEMDSAAPFATQASVLGPDWQYWSRRYDRVPTPRGIWTHVLTVLGGV